MDSNVDKCGKKQMEDAWLTCTDGGALCKTCTLFYASRSLLEDHSGVVLTETFNNRRKSTDANKN